MYCLADELGWLKDAIVNFLKDVTQVNRERGRTPVPVVIDYVGEAADLAATMGVNVIPRHEGSDPHSMWDQLKAIAT